jgi:RNA polymerase sigma-70 factor (ECF subfamily)
LVITVDSTSTDGLGVLRAIVPDSIPTSAPDHLVIKVDAVSGEPTSDVAANAAMDRYASGEAAAFSELYDRLAPRLYAYLLRQTRNSSRTEDLVQQTMLQIHAARGRFIRGAAVAPWAFAIARRLLIDDVRRTKFERRHTDGEDGGAAECLAAPGLPADDMVHSNELAQMIRRVLERLPEGQRAAFELVKQEGLTHAEAAYVLGTTVMAVKLRAHRTYAALRAALGPLFEMRDS